MEKELPQKQDNRNANPFEKASLFTLAQNSLQGRWVPAILTALIIGIVSAVSSIIPFGSLIIYGALYLGAGIWALKFVRNENFDYEDVFAGFNNFGNALAMGLLQFLIIMGFTLLLIIPGIIAALSLSQSFFIMADNPGITPSDALRKSHEMMKGNRSELFGIYLVFFLLAILSIITLGIGFIFLIPYMRILLTHFYLRLKGENPDEVKEIDHLITE